MAAPDPAYRLACAPRHVGMEISLLEALAVPVTPTKRCSSPPASPVKPAKQRRSVRIADEPEIRAYDGD
eukprot:11210908-Lingulodinium_polyedra.AAC.1